MSPKIFQAVLYTLTAGLCVVALTACSAGGLTNENTVTPTRPTPSVTPLAVAQQPTSVPTTEATPTSTLDLVIWWPEPLAPADQPDVTDLLNAQISAFAESEGSEIDIEFRLKRHRDVGGIMATLRTASNVAPGALPDLTLMRREDLLSAVQSGLIYPLEGLISSSIIGDLYDSALALGQVDDQIYGLPYTLEVQHLVYLPEDENDLVILPWTFEDFLARGDQWVFPAGRTGGISNILYAQYLDAGGTPLAEGELTLNSDALGVVFEFYEEAFDQGIVTDEVFDYVSSAEYVDDLAVGLIDTGLMTSTAFLEMRADNSDLGAAPLPSETGLPVSPVNGWVWVMTTNNSDRQALAARFMSWMMSTEEQREYVETMNMLPSQRSTLQQMNLVDVELMDAMLENAILPLPDRTGSAFGRALQNALTAVLSGQSTGEEAVQIVVDQVEG